MRITAIRPFTLSIGVMHQKYESPPFSGGSPLEHLQIAIGVAEGCNWATADVRVDTDRFALFVVNKV